MTLPSWRFPFPRSLGGQLIGLLLIALIVAQAISIWIFHDERRIAMIAIARDNILMRAVSIAKLIDDTPSSIHDQVLEASSSGSPLSGSQTHPLSRGPATSTRKTGFRNFYPTGFHRRAMSGST